LNTQINKSLEVGSANASSSTRRIGITNFAIYVSRTSAVGGKQFPYLEITVDEPWLFREKVGDHYIHTGPSDPFERGEELVEVKQYEHIPLYQILAKQFIPNPNGYKCIEHMNGNLSDNSLSNLRWASSSMIRDNPKNNFIKKGDIKFMTELPAGYIPLTKYKKEEFDDLFIKWENSIPSFIIKNNNKFKKYNTLKPDKTNSYVRYNGLRTVLIWFSDLKP
jgi:hypothetical protein